MEKIIIRRGMPRRPPSLRVTLGLCGLALVAQLLFFAWISQ